MADTQDDLPELDPAVAQTVEKLRHISTPALVSIVYNGSTEVREKAARVLLGERDHPLGRKKAIPHTTPDVPKAVPPINPALAAALARYAALSEGQKDRKKRRF